MGLGPDSISRHASSRLAAFSALLCVAHCVSCSFLQKKTHGVLLPRQLLLGLPDSHPWRGHLTAQGTWLLCLRLHQTLFGKTAQSPTCAETISSPRHSQLSSLHAGLVSSMQLSLPGREIGTQLGKVELAGGAQWLECQLEDGRISCSIPSQGHVPSSPGSGICERQPINVSLSHIDVSPSLLLS